LLARAILLTTLITLAACGAARRDFREFDGTWEHAASHTETLPLPLVAGGALSVDLAAGNLVVRADANAAPSVRVTYEILAASSLDAQRLLPDCETSVLEEGDAIRVRTLFRGLPVGARARAHLSIVVPPGVSVEARADAGDVLLDGGTVGLGPARAIASAGDAEVTGAHGGAHVEAKTGSARAAGCTGGEVTVSANEGHASVEGVQAERVEAATSSGRVLVADSRAEVFRATSDSGAVELRDVIGAIEAACASGEVSLRDAAVPRAELKSGFGPVRAERVAGDVEATSTSGPIVLEDVAGSVRVSCGYGTVRISGALRSLDAHSGTGDVRAIALPGSAIPDSGWSLRSDQGHVVLSLPPGLGVSLDARTMHGEVSCDLPVALEAGAGPSLTHLRGAVEGGGPGVLLETGDGDIRVLATGSGS
jgi:hypothetical protein